MLNIWSMLSRKLMMSVAVFITLGGMGISNLAPLPQPPAPTPVDTFQPSSTPAPTGTPAAPTPTSANLTPTTTFTPLPAVTQIPSDISSLPPLDASSNSVKIYFFSVGLGDSILIIAPDGKTMLVDGGPEDSKITSYLHKLGIRKIDVMVATHPHVDHIAGLTKVLRAFPVKRLYTNGQENDNEPAYKAFEKARTYARVPEKHVRRGETIRLGSLTFQVLNPRAKLWTPANENSIVLRFSYGKTTVLLMGDADHVTEKNILDARLPVKADILKLGHHGAASSSSTAFLKAVHPAVGIYSSAYGNKFGFPEKATLDRLRKLGAKVYGTDKNGTILVTIDSSGYKIKLSKGQ